MGYVREATLRDIPMLAPRLREIDKQECDKLSGATPEQALKAGILAGNAKTIVGDDETIIGMFGVARSLLPGVGIAWMLCSDDLVDVVSHRKQFLTHNRFWVELMNDKYPVLFNYILKDNKLAIRWLRWLGFEFSSTPAPDVLMFKKVKQDV